MTVSVGKDAEGNPIRLTKEPASDHYAELKSHIFDDEEYYSYTVGKTLLLRRKIGSWVNITRFEALFDSSHIPRFESEDGFLKGNHNASRVRKGMERFSGVWAPLHVARDLAMKYKIDKQLAPLLDFERVAKVKYMGYEFYEFFAHVYADTHIRILKDVSTNRVNMDQVFTFFRLLKGKDRSDISVLQRSFYHHFKGNILTKGDKTLCGGHWVEIEHAAKYARKHGFYNHLKLIFDFTSTPDEAPPFIMDVYERSTRMHWIATYCDNDFYEFPLSFKGGDAPKAPLKDPETGKQKKQFSYRDLTVERRFNVELTKQGVGEYRTLIVLRRKSDGWVNVSAVIETSVIIRLSELDLGKEDPDLLIENELYYRDCLEAIEYETVVSSRAKSLNGKWCSAKDARRIFLILNVSSTTLGKTLYEFLSLPSMRHLEVSKEDGASSDESDDDSEVSDFEAIEENDFLRTKHQIREKDVYLDKKFFRDEESSDEEEMEVHGATEDEEERGYLLSPSEDVRISGKSKKAKVSSARSRSSKSAKNAFNFKKRKASIITSDDQNPSGEVGGPSRTDDGVKANKENESQAQLKPASKRRKQNEVVIEDSDMEVSSIGEDVDKGSSDSLFNEDSEKGPAQPVKKSTQATSDAPQQPRVAPPPSQYQYPYHYQYQQYQQGAYSYPHPYYYQQHQYQQPQQQQRPPYAYTQPSVPQRPSTRASAEPAPLEESIRPLTFTDASDKLRSLGKRLKEVDEGFRLNPRTGAKLKKTLSDLLGKVSMFNAVGAELLSRSRLSSVLNDIKLKHNEFARLIENLQNRWLEECRNREEPSLTLDEKPRQYPPSSYRRAPTSAADSSSVRGYTDTRTPPPPPSTASTSSYRSPPIHGSYQPQPQPQSQQPQSMPPTAQQQQQQRGYGHYSPQRPPQNAYSYRPANGGAYRSGNSTTGNNNTNTNNSNGYYQGNRDTRAPAPPPQQYPVRGGAYQQGNRYAYPNNINNSPYSQNRPPGPAPVNNYQHNQKAYATQPSGHHSAHSSGHSSAHSSNPVNFQHQQPPQQSQYTRSPASATVRPHNTPPHPQSQPQSQSQPKPQSHHGPLGGSAYQPQHQGMRYNNHQSQVHSQSQSQSSTSANATATTSSPSSTAPLNKDHSNINGLGSKRAREVPPLHDHYENKRPSYNRFSNATGPNPGPVKERPSISITAAGDTVSKVVKRDLSPISNYCADPTEPKDPLDFGIDAFKAHAMETRAKEDEMFKFKNSNDYQKHLDGDEMEKYKKLSRFIIGTTNDNIWRRDMIFEDSGDGVSQFHKTLAMLRERGRRGLPLP